MKVTEKQNSKLDLNKLPTDLTDNTYFGRLSLKDNDFFGLIRNHNGLLSDFNIWSSSLSIDDMMKWTSCG